MADKTVLLVPAVQTELAITCKSGTSVYPYVYRRAYICGHTPEFIRVSESADQEGIVQTVLRPDQVKDQDKGQSDNWFRYKLGRCRSCAIRFRDRHQIMQERGKGGKMRPLAAYQGEGIRLDRGLLREAKSGFEAALKQLDRVSCCGGEEQEEEEWPLTREGIGGDDDSIRVVRFLDGRRKVDSPAPSPSPFSNGFGDPWSLRGGGQAMDNYGLADCAACAEHRQRQRKDSAFKIHPNADPRFNNGVPTLRRAGARKEYLQNVYLEAPRAPTAFTFGPHSDLDWLRFSYLLRNNQLSFDDIAELVTKYSLDDSDPLLNDIAQHSLSIDPQPNDRNSALQTSTRQTGVVEWNVSPGQEDSQASTLRSGSSRTTSAETRCRAESQNTDDMEPCYHEPGEALNLPEEGDTDEMEEQAIRVEDTDNLDQSCYDRYSNEPDVSQSCFSSDSSSVESTDFSKAEVDVTTTRKRPIALSWWKPKRKYDGIDEVTRATSIPNFQEYPVGLWKKISKKTSHHRLDRYSKDKVNLKPQVKLSMMEESLLRASRVSQKTANHDSDRHATHMNQSTTPNVQSESSSLTHILNAMESLDSPRASQRMTRSTKSQRGNHNSPTCLTKSRPSSSTHSTKVVIPHGIHPVHRPYKPSPLKHFTRVHSLDVNKGLPPLPPEARRLARQASKGTLKEVAAVRKVAIQKVMRKYVDETAQAC